MFLYRMKTAQRRIAGASAAARTGRAAAARAGVRAGALLQ
jgi:hypothetical protein